jgi:hypothetical protein
MIRRLFAGCAAIAALLILFPAAAPAGTLSTSVMGLFPKDMNEFAYADLKTARKFKWFAQLKEQMLPSRFRQFEQFLSSAGIDPNTQVDELAWALKAPTATEGELVVGVALGQFQPESAEAYFKAQKLPLARLRGFTLFAFGSGTGPNDIFFFFIDSNTAAFGHRSVLEQLVEVRYGGQESLLRNDVLFPLINEANGRGLVWAVLDPTYTRIGLNQTIPEAAQFPEASNLLSKIRALTIRVEADRGVDASFQAVCAGPEEANVFAALLEAGILYRRHQEAQSNPDLAKALEDIRVTPRGDRLDVRMSLTEETLLTLIRRQTFAVRM